MDPSQHDASCLSPQSEKAKKEDRGQVNTLAQKIASRKTGTQWAIPSLANNHGAVAMMMSNELEHVAPEELRRTHFNVGKPLARKENGIICEAHGIELPSVDRDSDQDRVVWDLETSMLSEDSGGVVMAESKDSMLSGVVGLGGNIIPTMVYPVK
ncbi:hypothetical protein N7504_012018 [Penicillium tannophilum]|nr:hypothetical protein N7504_012018 [Penicillium tannophilum]